MDDPLTILTPDQAYGTSTGPSPDELLDLIDALAERLVQPLDAQQVREDLLLRAVFWDRHLHRQSYEFGDIGDKVKLEDLAQQLIQFDQDHDTGRGGVPANDPRWSHPLRTHIWEDSEEYRIGYVRQEYKQWQDDEIIREEVERERWESEPDPIGEQPCPHCGTWGWPNPDGCAECHGQFDSEESSPGEGEKA